MARERYRKIANVPGVLEETAVRLGSRSLSPCGSRDRAVLSYGWINKAQEHLVGEIKRKREEMEWKKKSLSASGSKINNSFGSARPGSH